MKKIVGTTECLLRCNKMLKQVVYVKCCIHIEEKLEKSKVKVVWTPLEKSKDSLTLSI